MSPEVHVILAPSTAFRKLAQREAAGTWVLIRRPLFLALMLGCAVSFLASSRLSVRLIVDGAISFAFVPFFEITALAIVFRRTPRRISFARSVDISFASHMPWFLWMLGIMAVCVAELPRDAAIWTNIEVGIALAGLAVAVAWSLYIDLIFFREVLPGRPGLDLIVFRAIEWTCVLTYFLGFAIWPDIVGRLPS